jgi:hypothetical protein
MAGRDPQHDQTQWSNPGLTTVFIATAAVAFFAALAVVTRAIGAASIPIWAIAIWGAAMISRGPIGQAIARNIGGHVQDGPTEAPAEVYAELDELRARVGELEERVDFSERLLTAAKEKERAGGER